jgi:hypothetical protein
MYNNTRNYNEKMYFFLQIHPRCAIYSVNEMSKNYLKIVEKCV